MNNCSLCLNKTLKKNSIKIDKKQECNSTIEEIIKQHFWFFDTILKFASLQKSSIICKSCWEKLENFHEFFIAVKFNHKIDENQIKENKSFSENNEILIKIETKEIENSIDFNDQKDSDFEDNFSISKITNESENEEKEKIEKPPKKRKIDKTTEAISEKKQKFDVSNEELEILKIHTELKCEKCTKNFEDWQDIRSHYRKEHKIIGYIRCCGRKIDRSTEVKDHANWHLNPHIFQCHICGKSAISREHLKLHEEIHIPESERAFACDKCDKKFVNRYNLNMHIKIHEKDNKAATIPCNFCDKLFKTNRQLKSHVDFCHKNADQSWICHICSKVLKNRYTLDIHVKAHTDPDDPIECELCGHVLKNKRRFAIHMAKHKSAEAGPYECEKGCGKIFKHRPAMLDHIAFVHTKNRFNCSCCGREFKHKKALEEHEVTQHGGLDLYSCPFCERTFKNSSNMHSHKKKAHPDEYKNLPAPSYLKGGTLGDYCE